MYDGATQARDPIQVPANCLLEEILDVRHYTDRLFSFRTSRSNAFRFRSGEFVMIGLPGATPPVFRAYSIASPSWDEQLEFFSIKVPDGPLTARLQLVKPGDPILLRSKTTGTLVHDALTPGRRLYLFSTGTGIAPFASIVRDPETYEKFDEVILTHTCRAAAELDYGHQLFASTVADPLVGELAKDRLVHYATTTREPSARMGRITDLLRGGRVGEELGLPPLSPETDRAMICGSMDMIRDVKALLEEFGLVEGSNNRPASYVVERAFVS